MKKAVNGMVTSVVSLLRKDKLLLPGWPNLGDRAGFAFKSLVRRVGSCFFFLFIKLISCFCL